MEFALDPGNATYQIQTYKDGCILVNGQKYCEAIVVMPELLIVPWGPQSFDSLQSDHFELLLSYKPHLVLLGTGAKLRFPSPNIYAVLTEQQIGVEVMDTAAACRTYKILQAEGRHIAAALLP